jgi:alanine dehydrogenase
MIAMDRSPRIPRSIGFPRMIKESGEKRVFLPEFIQFLARKGLTVFLEEGYGSRSGFSFDDYRQAGLSICQCGRREAYRQDLVLVLRSPMREDYALIPAGRCLITMLHFPTRPRRVARLRQMGLQAISLDGITDDANLRLVENMKAVAWNGLEVAFDVLERRNADLRPPHGGPIRVLILGSGMVGKHAVEAAVKFGNLERHLRLLQTDGPGVAAVVIGRNVSGKRDAVRDLFRETDILVDATQRRDPSRPVVPNAWLAWLPEQAVIADLAVDPYLPDAEPRVVRGIEGIPQGNLDRFVFEPDDPDWRATIPEGIPADNRRTTVTCYSWPGIHPEACMQHYARQLEPLMETLIEKGYDGLSPEGSYFERALYRATLKNWIGHGRYQPRPR